MEIQSNVNPAIQKNIQDIEEQNKILEKVLNTRLLIATFKYKGSNNKTTIDDKRAITPISLSGIERKIA